jgi:hypothetical protein
MLFYKCFNSNCEEFVFFYSVNTIAGSASSNDFEPVTSLQLTLISTLPVCFNVTIKQDLLVEGNETFSVQLSTSNPRVDIPDRTSLVHIVDDGKTGFEIPPPGPLNLVMIP